jgi:hemerythrin-like domain-containing protein
MNAVQLIKQDHRAVKGLFRKFHAAKGAEKQRIAQQIITELSVHAAVEEELLYPALRERDPKLHDKVLEALEEHHVAKTTLAELDKMDISDERYDAKMMVLKESVEHHIEEEEGELLPRLERLFPAETLEAMAQEMMAMKETVPDHPHPMAPDTPPGNFVSGVLAKLLDAGKDLFRTVTSPNKAAGRRRAKARASATKKRSATRRRHRAA